MSPSLSITMWPTPASSAMRSSASSRALPWWTIAPGRSRRAARDAARRPRRRRSRGPPARRAPSPPSPGTPSRRRRPRSRRGRRRGTPRRTRARARAGPPRRRRRRACRSARRARCTSQPPISQAPAIVDAAADRVDVGEGLHGRHRAAIIAVGARRRGGRRTARLRQSMAHERKRNAFGRDTGLQARMALTLFLLGLVYAVLVAALLVRAHQRRAAHRHRRRASSSSRRSARTRSGSPRWARTRSRPRRSPSSTRSSSGSASRPTCPSRASR